MLLSWGGYRALMASRKKKKKAVTLNLTIRKELAEVALITDWSNQE